MKKMIGSMFVMATAFTGSQAFGAMTTVNGPASGELSHEQILEQAYGIAELTGDTSTGFTGGGFTFTRLDDNLDQFFVTDGFDAEARALFASATQRFGIIRDGGSYENLFTVSGSGTSVSGSVNDIEVEGWFRFARGGNIGVVPAETYAANNPGGIDQVVTYLVEGPLSGKNPVYVLFFEDQGIGNGDYDFNDLVVEIAGATAIPTPAAAGLGLAMLGGALLRRRNA